MSAVFSTSSWLENIFDITSSVFQPPWLQAFRTQQFKKFRERGLPTMQEERWKYTPVSYLERTNFSLPIISNKWPKNCLEENLNSIILLVFNNGHFSEEMSDLHLLPPEVILSPLSAALQAHEHLVKPYLLQQLDGQRHPFMYLNSAFLNEGIFLQIPKNCVIPYPIHFLFLNINQSYFMASPRNIIVAHENSQVKIIEEHRAYQAENYFINVVTELYTNSNARVDYYKLQREHLTSTHIANINVHQKQNSCVNTFLVDFGSRLAREDLTINLYERRATCHMKGLYLLRHDDQHIDNHIYVDHAAENCTSSVLYKGILDKKSQAVFNSKVYAHVEAKKTHAQQTNHNLLLSSSAEVNTKPELEIYTDDVTCLHGATVGQVNAEALFYLRARGIEKEAALKLLAHAFITDVIEKIEDSAMKNYIQRQVSHYAGL
ncbi:MAG: sufD [Gammaproteobacteria bacterium]|jgi:Fe-S cluster assembly protein SufD|nr:sufD [Gammaproteobacteria bacterium]